MSLLLPALATVMRIMRKKPTVQTAATGSTTVAKTPETEAKDVMMVFTSDARGIIIDYSSTNRVIRANWIFKTA